MYFHTYDFDKSSYVNWRDQLKSQTIQATRNVSTLFNVIQDIEDTRLGTKHLSTIDRSDTFILDGELYYQFIKTNGHNIQLPDPEGNRGNLDVYTYNDDLKNCIVSPITGSPLENTTGTSSYRSPSRIDILNFIRQYKADVGSFGFRDLSNNLMDLEATRDMVLRVETYVNSLPDITLTMAFQPYHYVKPRVGMSNISDRIPLIMGIQELGVGNVLYTRTDISTSKPSYIECEWDGITKSFDFQIKSAYPNFNRGFPTTTYTNFFDVNTDTTAQERYLVLGSLFFRYGLVDQFFKATNNELRWRYGESGESIDAYTVRVTKNYIIDALGSLLTEINDLIALNNQNNLKARQTPLGRYLWKYKYLETILDQDTSGLNEMYISFRIQNVNGYNKLEDNDQANSLEPVKIMMSEVYDWYKYVFPLVQITGDMPNLIYRVVGYIPNWGAMEKAPYYKRARILQEMFRIEAGIPAQKTSTWDKIKQVAVVVVVAVISVYTAGLGTTTAYLVITTATVQTIAIITEDAKLASLAKDLGTATAIIGSLQNLFTLPSSITLSQSIGYALQIGQLAYSEYNKKRIEQVQGEIRSISEKIDEVEELALQQDLDTKIKNFIYGGSINNQYTYQYNYSIEYKYI